jgi:hypothetical protein
MEAGKQRPRHARTQATPQEMRERTNAQSAEPNLLEVPLVERTSEIERIRALAALRGEHCDRYFA